MPTVYFPVLRYHLTNFYIKENSNTDSVVNVKSYEISNELGQNISGSQIYLNFAQNSESAFLAERSRRVSGKVDFNIIRDPNILLGLINHGKMFAYSTLSYKPFILHQYL